MTKINKKTGEILSEESAKIAKKSVEAAVKKEISTHVEPELAHGFEEMTSDSFTIPFLNIVQSLTPIYQNENKSADIKLGAIYDSVSQEAYQKIKVIPVHYQRRWIEWKPRELGGGFVAIHVDCPKDAVRGEKGLVLPNGNKINDTRQHYVLYQDHSGLYNAALISMKSTAIVLSQTWCTQMQRCREMITGENGLVVSRRQSTYERQYELTTVLKRKNADQWYAWNIRLLTEKVDGAALREAKEFYDILTKTSKVDVQQSYAQADSSEEPAY